MSCITQIPKKKPEICGAVEEFNVKSIAILLLKGQAFDLCGERKSAGSAVFKFVDDLVDGPGRIQFQEQRKY